ncbi:MAG: rhodanese-like domain-containing protein [Actinomycetota bacterium]|nr:rhodanese-like domain-containing protein [Actinomycetota bacterium]
MYKTITREELQAKRERGENFRLVNVLPASAFAEAHIPGSENVPLTEIEERAPALWEPDEEIIVYCRSFDCNASPMAATFLDRLGFINVWDFEGGMEDWIDGGGDIAYERRAA